MLSDSFAPLRFVIPIMQDKIGIGAWLGGAITDKKGPVFSAVVSGAIAFVGFSLFPLWVTDKWEFVIASVIASL